MPHDLRVKFNDAEWDLIEETSEKEEITFSTLIRTACLKYCTRKFVDGGSEKDV